MKQYFIGFITGACLIASAVMFMGAGESNSKIGKYQGFGDDGYEYLINTETGQLWDWEFKHDRDGNQTRGWSPRESTFLKK